MQFASKPTPPPKPDYHELYISPDFALQETGDCRSGNYIKIFIPQNPYLNDRGHRKIVIYMHGFALGAPTIYHSHLVHLVKQGFYVFYPIYQRGFCKVQQSFWKNFYELFQAALNPCPVNAEGWIMDAIESVKNAHAEIETLNSGVDTYIFGHSLGGLQALSWPYYASGNVPSQLLPQQVIAVDPIPTSDANIPLPIRCFLNILGGFKNKVDIHKTGECLTVPVAILHGNKDCIVPLRAWKNCFKEIKSPHKKFYLSQTDHHGFPIMHANHMQASVNTRFLPDWMARLILNGVGVENNLNWRYIWFALDQIIHEKVRADQLVFDMGQWSDEVKVLNPCEYLPQAK